MFNFLKEATVISSYCGVVVGVVTVSQNPYSPSSVKLFVFFRNTENVKISVQTTELALLILTKKTAQNILNMT